MPVQVKTFFHAPTGSATHLVAAPGGPAAIVDPALDFDPARRDLGTAPADRILAWAAARGLRVAYVLETHVHADHLTGADYIRACTGAEVVIGASVRAMAATCPAAPAGGRTFDRWLRNGDRLALGPLTVTVLETPGHTPACVTYLVEPPEAGAAAAAFVGDALFMPDAGTGRADFPGGDAAVLHRSIRKILALPPATRLYVGHDYPPPPRMRRRAQTTVAAQRARNVHVGEGVAEADFVSFRRRRDAGLAPPALMAWAVPFNLRAGRSDAL